MVHRHGASSGLRNRIIPTTVPRHATAHCNDGIRKRQVPICIQFGLHGGNVDAEHEPPESRAEKVVGCKWAFLCHLTEPV